MFIYLFILGFETEFSGIHYLNQADLRLIDFVNAALRTFTTSKRLIFIFNYVCAGMYMCICVCT